MESRKDRQGIDTDPTVINNLKVISNEDPAKFANLAGKGLIRFLYHESMMHDTIHATIEYVDTGDTDDTIGGINVLEALPIVGTEKVEIKFEDFTGAKIGDSPKLNLYVNKVTPLGSDTRKGVVRLDLVSKEFLLNEKVKLRKRYDGKISDNIEKILTDPIGEGLGTEKNIDFEDTLNNFNFIGNNRKSFYTLNWLSKKSISAQNQKKGKSAGYFFWETSMGYHFKSIDGLFLQKPKKKIIYTETPDEMGKYIPEGYDYKCIEYNKDNLINASNKLRMGAFSTRIVMFDPFKCVYEVVTPNVDDFKDELKLAGKKLPKLNEELEVPGAEREFSRTTYYLLDKGTLPSGNTEQQIEKSEEENFEYRDILNQSIMRYNQFLSFAASITIPGDFSLHAGDMIHLDVPLLEVDKKDNTSKMDSGLYIITDLTHLITGSETYTKLDLVRDSSGKKRQE